MTTRSAMSNDVELVPVEHHVQGLSPAGFHRFTYLEWGAPASASTVICVHGLTRNARDFDVLARKLAVDRRVIAVNVVGRGTSDWLSDPVHYAYPQYLADMAVLLARLDVEVVDWIGTSMGGLIGLMLAAQANSPIRSLIANDVGPFIPKEALTRIADYVGLDNRFSSLEAVERHLRKVHAPFGALTDEQWAHLAKHGHRPLSDNNLGLAYDPRIAENVKKATSDIDLWALWNRITCPTLILRGRDSDLLLKATAEEMTRTGPMAELVEFDGIGHAPALMAGDQIDVISNWLGQQR